VPLQCLLGSMDLRSLAIADAVKVAPSLRAWSSGSF
jgi:hypothetical protein